MAKQGAGENGYRGVKRISAFLEQLRTDQRAYCTAVVPAAGSSTRMGGRDKLMLQLEGKPVLLHTLEALEACPEVDAIVIATRREQVETLQALISCTALTKVRQVLAGGDSRAESVRLAIEAAPGQTRLIAVHDGARPLATPEVIGRAIRMAARTNAAIVAVPVKDTIKVVQNGHVTSTPERASLYAAQTPQVFDRDLLLGAYGNAAVKRIECTDDAMAVEAMGVSVAICQGDYENLKITTPEDIPAAETILRKRRQG